MVNEYEINTSDLTTGVVGGTGVFDELMKAVDASLIKEFSSNRITGVNYSTVYLGGLQSVLQNATQFLLEKDRAGLAALQIEKQIAIAEAELALRTTESNQNILESNNRIAIANAEIALRTAESNQNILESNNRINLANAEIALRTAESNQNILESNNRIAIANTEIVLRTAESESQIALQTSQRLNLDKELELKAKELELRTEQILIAREELKIKEKDFLIRAEQVLLTKEELLIKKQELIIAAKELELREKALVKTDSEIALLNQKTRTEAAQTVDTFDGEGVTGVVGKQKELFTAQKDGFTNDHIQKMTKLQLDIYAVNKSAIPEIDQGMFINKVEPYLNTWNITGGPTDGQPDK